MWKSIVLCVSLFAGAAMGLARSPPFGVGARAMGIPDGRGSGGETSTIEGGSWLAAGAGAATGLTAFFADRRGAATIEGGAFTSGTRSAVGAVASTATIDGAGGRRSAAHARFAGRSSRFDAVASRTSATAAAPTRNRCLI